MAKLETEIQQKHFRNEQHKAFVNVLFTSSWLSNRISAALKEYQLTTQQFNVLRILRGSNPKPTSITDLISLMIDKMSNASRLVDKLEKKGFVARTSSEDDRRRVDVIITPQGLDVVNKASVSVEKKIDELFDSLSYEESKELNRFLDLIRT